MYITLPLVAMALVACSTATAPTDQPESENNNQQSSAMEDVMNDDMAAKDQSLTFDGKSTLVDHPGGFSDFTVGTALAHTQQFTEAVISATIQMDSVYSDNERLTGHLKKEDFFDVANYPTASFTTTSITATDTVNQYDVTADLTIKGITAEVSGTIVYIDDSVTITADVPRKTFSVGNDAYGEKLLAEMIPVTLEYRLTDR